MARVPKRPYAFFRLSPAADGRAQCFAVRRGDVDKKQIGASLYAPALRVFLQALSRSRFTTRKLRDEVALNPVADLGHLDGNSLVSFVPMEAVEERGVGSAHLYTRRLEEVVKGYTPFADGDVLWAKITPCMENGKSCIVSGLTNGVGFGSTEFHVLRPLTERVTKEYLHEFLALPTLRSVAKLAFTGSAGHQRVPEEFLADLPFPMPEPAAQAEFVSAMDAARAERQAKLTEADALLAGLDGFLLATLGLTPPPRNNRRVFAVHHAAVPARFDPHFHLPAFAQNARMLTDHGAEPLGSLVEFSDEVWRPERHEERTFRYIEISNVNPNTGEARAEEVPVAEAPSRARMAVRTSDIIVSLTRPHHGAIAHITPDLNGCVASTGFSVLRNVNEARVTREYLWCVLRSKMCLSQMLQRASGGNYPAITEPELAKVLLPVPTLDVQETIATEARRRREEARRLRAEAEAGWQAAKSWFEEQLLAPAQP